MESKLKEEIQEMKIPREKIQQRIELGVNQAEAKMNPKKKKNRNRYSNWLIGSVASVIIIGATWTVGGSYIAEATNSLINQIFGSKESIKETFPEGEVTEESITEIEQDLEILKKNLSEDDFTEVSRLIKEQTEIMKNANGNILSDEQNKKLEDIQVQLQKLIGNFLDPEIHNLEDVQEMVSYRIARPSYVPEGYELITEEAVTQAGEHRNNPVVTLKFGSKIDGFEIIQQQINDNNMFNLYDNVTSYVKSGYDFEFGYFNHFKERNMRLVNQEEGFEIVIHSDSLTQEEMEKTLLSMVEEEE